MSSDAKKHKKLSKPVAKAIVKAMVGKGKYRASLKSGNSPPKSVMKMAQNSAQAGFAKGHGDYFGDLVGGLASKYGSKLGNWLSEKAKKMVGMGDYKEGDVTVSDHELVGNSLCAGTQAPVIQNKGQAFIMRHREYVGDVVSSVAFSVQSYPINPGNQSTFPWLSNIASAFEEYQVVGMIAEYKPLISFTNTNANGAVVFATEYNVGKPNFTSKIQMENYEYATSCTPYQSMMHAIECAPNQTPFGGTHRDILIGTVPAGQDARLYMLGNLQIATQGQATATTIGELWLTYEIALFKPLFSVAQGLDILSYRQSSISAAVTTNIFPETPAQLNAFPTSPGSLLGMSWGLLAGSNTLFFPTSIITGSYQCTLSIIPTALSTWIANPETIANGFSISNGNLLSIWYNDNNASPQSNSINIGGVACAMTMTVTFQVVAPGNLVCGIKFPILQQSLTNQIIYRDILITQINGSIVT